MAKLLDGTRIYGTANVDTQINVGANVVINTSAIAIGNSTANLILSTGSNTSFNGNVSIGGTLTVASNVMLSAPITFTSGGGGMGIWANNRTIDGVNSLSFADPGPYEGLTWGGGTGWAIFESPNDITTNASGNLQFVVANTRIFTISNTQVESTKPVAVQGGVQTFTGNGQVAFTATHLYANGNATRSLVLSTPAVENSGSPFVFDTANALDFRLDSNSILTLNSDYTTTVNSVTTFLKDVIVSGNLTTSGTTTYINTTNLNIGDNIITLNADLGAAVAPTENAGIEVNRGSSTNTSLYWNESRGRWGAYPPATFAGVATNFEAYGNNASITAQATGNSTSNTIAIMWATQDTAGLTLDSTSSIAASAKTTYIDLRAPDYRGSGIYVTQTTAPQGGANAYWFVGKPYTGGAFQIGYGTNPEYQSNAAILIDTSKRVGIGTQSPQAQLHIAGTSAAIRLEDTDDSRIGAIIQSGLHLYYDTDVGNAGTGTHRFRISGYDQLMITRTASAVNYLQVSGAATGSYPVVTAQGSDTHVGLRLASKGAGVVAFATNHDGNPGSTGNLQAAVTHTAGTVNYLSLTGAAAGSGPTLGASGNDTNIDLNLTTKGTGSVVVKDGGGTLARFSSTGGTLVSYPVLVGSQYGSVAYYTVDGVASNIDTQISSKGTGSVRFQTNYATQFNITHTASAVNYVQVTGAATTAQPTISAQGSDSNIQLNLASKGVATVALVANGRRQFDSYGTAATANFLRASGNVTGSAPALQAQGDDANVDLNLTPKGTGTVVATGPFTATGQTSLGGAAGSEGLRVNTVAAAVNYVGIQGDTSISPKIYSAGSGTNLNLLLSSKGIGGINFYSNGLAQQQFAITHTASAVNYLQVTGGATGSGATISTQGSDTNVELLLYSKGAAVVALNTNGKRQFEVYGGTSTGANWLRASGSATGSPVKLAALGTDTNIDLNLTAKGTGVTHSTTPLRVETDTTFTSKTLTTTATTANQVIAAFDISTYRSAEFTVQATDTTGSKFQKLKIIAIHNGSTVEFTEYGNVWIGGYCGTFSVVFNSGNSTFDLVVTPTSTNSTEFKATCMLTGV